MSSLAQGRTAVCEMVPGRHRTAQTRPVPCRAMGSYTLSGNGSQSQANTDTAAVRPLVFIWADVSNQHRGRVSCKSTYIMKLGAAASLTVRLADNRGPWL